MHYKKSLLLAAPVATALVSTTACSNAEQASKFPNVIVILADDQGYGDFAVHGNPIIKTPHLDKMYNESVRLTDFHVAPMSSPTRGQLMTGWDAMRNGCTAVCEGRSMPDIDLPMMPQFFKEAGYSTGHFGKWHMGDSYPYRPHDRGFEVSLHLPGWGISSLPDFFHNSYFDPKLRLNDEVVETKGYSADVIFDEAIEWLKKCKEQGKPSFTYIASNTPHAPEYVGEEYSDPYNQIGEHEGKTIPANFYGMITNLDDNMAKLDQFLTESGMMDNTIVIYTSDNGTQNALAMKLYNAGMKGQKCSVFEGGHRVPCYIRWPEGGLLHGKDVDQLTVIQDILPSLVDMCNLTDGTLPPTDGVSLKSILTDENAKLADRMKVVHYRYKLKDGKWENAAVMWDKWRLTAPNALYDVSADPHQDNNIAAQHPDIVAKMSAHYDEWYEEAKELYKKERVIIVGSDVSNPVELTANDWNGGYCDNMNRLFAGKERGFHNIYVDQAGEYEIKLSRWQLDSEIELCGYDPELIRPSDNIYMNPVDPSLAAKPITQAQLIVGDYCKTISTDPTDKVATFTLELEKGENRIEGIFLDKNSTPICGAFYIEMLRK
ncbi:MAG: arylsulfatase [Rikenellaceae bacterium]